MTRNFTSGLALFVALISLVLAVSALLSRVERAPTRKNDSGGLTGRVAELAERDRARDEELRALRTEVASLRDTVASLRSASERRALEPDRVAAATPELVDPAMPAADDSAEFLLHRSLMDGFHALAPADREDALEELARYARWGDEEALALIEESLSDASPDVRREALKELAELDPANLEAHLKRALTDPAAKVREVVADRLRKLPPEEAGPMLVGLLGDSDGDVVERAIKSIHELDYSAAAPALREQLRSDDLDIATRAADALAELGDPGAVAGTIDRIMGEFQRGDVSDRIEHVKRLRRLEAQRQLESILESDASLAVREEARKALADLED